jgi:hypothetical protein
MQKYEFFAIFLSFSYSFADLFRIKLFAIDQ